MALHSLSLEGIARRYRCGTVSHLRSSKEAVLTGVHPSFIL